MGSFITFEGLDGSGKSTHLERVAQRLEPRGLSVVRTKEPGGTPLGEAIRKILLDPFGPRPDGTMELLLLFAARRQHLLEVIQPALARGAVVLCDRFTDSTYAYQGAGRGVGFDVIAQLDELATGQFRPDRTILLDLPAAQAYERVRSSRKRASEHLNRIDGEPLEFYERVREGYLELARQDPNRFVIVKASGSIETTHAHVLAAIEPCLAPSTLQRNQESFDRSR